MRAGAAALGTSGSSPDAQDRPGDQGPPRADRHDEQGAAGGLQGRGGMKKLTAVMATHKTSAP